MCHRPWSSNARFNFYNKYYGSASLKGAYYSNYKGKFGVAGFMYAGTNPVMQFVGSNTISIWSNGNSLRFSVWNNTSFQSFFAGLPIEWNRSKLKYNGNMYQYYVWDEQINWSSFGKGSFPMGDYSGFNFK